MNTQENYVWTLLLNLPYPIWPHVSPFRIWQIRDDRGSLSAISTRIAMPNRSIQLTQLRPSQCRARKFPTDIQASLWPSHWFSQSHCRCKRIQNGTHFRHRICTDDRHYLHSLQAFQRLWAQILGMFLHTVRDYRPSVQFCRFDIERSPWIRGIGPSMLDTFRRSDPNTVLRPSHGICKRRTYIHHVPNIFHRPMVECMLRSMHDTYSRHRSNLVCMYTSHIHKFPFLDHHTADLGHVHRRNCRIRSICPKSLLRDWLVCHIRTRHTHIALCHYNRPALYCLGDILNCVPFRCAHQCCKKNIQKKIINWTLSSSPHSQLTSSTRNCVQSAMHHIHKCRICTFRDLCILAN